MTPSVELLYFDGCSGYEVLLAWLPELFGHVGLSAEVQSRRVETLADAERERFLGSPTLRVEGSDVDLTAATG